MAIEDNASIALIPSGYKSNKVYSVIPDDGDGDFTFSRSNTTATRVAASGLIENVSSNVPRLNYPLIDGVVQSCPALLLEPQRTNELQRTEQFDNSYWSKSQASITANDTISPNGSQTADKLVEDSSTNFHRVFVSPTTAAATYTFSVFAKADEREFLVLRNNLSGGNINACFNLTSGSISYNGFSGDAEIENYGNGWFRCSITETDPSGGATTFSILLSNSAVTNNAIPSYTGDGSSGLHIWGAQLEQGSYKTSYIPWDGSGTTTRSADVCNKSGVETLLGQTEGTLYLEFVPLDTSALQILFQIKTTGFTNVGQVDIRFQSGQIRTFGSDNSGATQFSIAGGSITAGTTYKAAIRYKTNDAKFYINGSSVGSDTSCSFTSSTKQQISFAESLTTFLPSIKVKQALVFKEALSDSELETLTS